MADDDSNVVPFRGPTEPRAPERSQQRRAGKMKLAERKRQIINWRLQGFSVPEIVELLHAKGEPGTKSSVEQHLNTALDTWSGLGERDVERLRTLQLARIDLALSSIMSLVQKGNLKAVDRMVKLEALRARLTGTEAPTKHEHSGTIDHRVDREEVSRLERAWLAGNQTEDIVDADAVDDTPALASGE